MKHYYHLTTKEILELPIREFYRNLAGLDETKFNRIVYIRTCSPKSYKNLSDEEKKIHNNWKNYCKEKEKKYRAEPQERISKEKQIAIDNEILMLFRGLAES